MAQIITHILPKTKNKSNEKIYHKINSDNDMIYYVRDEALTHLEKRLEEFYDMRQLLMFSDYAINIRTNEIVKCRNSIEVVVDSFLTTL